jgi:hypothetical protein
MSGAGVSKMTSRPTSARHDLNQGESQEFGTDVIGYLATGFSSGRAVLNDFDGANPSGPPRLRPRPAAALVRRHVREEKY